MNRRKDDLRALLLGGGGAPAPEETAATPPAEGRAPEIKSAPSGPRIRSTALDAEEPARAASGAVRAMGLSLGNMRRETEEAGRALAEKSAELAALQARIAEGGTILDLDAALIEASFAPDRLAAAAEAEADEPDFAAFLEDIRAHGQQVPILVRPHPDLEGRYQIAYGHRRWRAARRLGRPVRAAVKALSDIELVVAQGQENAQRRDLSFIEKAFFALALDQRGFDRATLCGALAVQTSEITRLLQVARAAPAALVAAIGPAPKTGRPRWLALIELLAKPGAEERLESILAEAGFRRLASDERFLRVFEALSGAGEAKAPPPRGEVLLADAQGRALIRRETLGRETRLVLDPALAPDFSALLVARLPSLYAEWQRGAAKDDRKP